MPDWMKYLGVALTAGATVFGVGRFVGTIEQRLSTLEGQQQYLYGEIRVPAVVPAMRQSK